MDGDWDLADANDSEFSFEKVGGADENEVLIEIGEPGGDDDDDEEEEPGEDEDEDEDAEAEMEFEIVEASRTVTQVIVAPEKRTTSDNMTRYEWAHLLGRRAQQLEGGARPHVTDIEGLSTLEIAEREILAGKVPLLIKRPVGKNKFELWRVYEMNRHQHRSI